MCTDEGVYVDSSGSQMKDVRLQWGEIPSSIGMSLYISTVYPHSGSIGMSLYISTVYPHSGSIGMSLYIQCIHKVGLLVCPYTYSVSTKWVYWYVPIY